MLKYDNKTVIKRKDRKGYMIRYRNNNKQYAIYGRTQKECLNKYKLTIKNIEQKTQNKNLTLKEWYIKFIELYKRNKVKETTIKSLSYDFEKLKNIYNKKINNLTAIQIQEELNKITFPSTRIRLYILLNSLFEKAMLNEIVAKNIIKIIDRPKYKAEQKTALTTQEEKNFIII